MKQTRLKTSSMSPIDFLNTTSKQEYEEIIPPGSGLAMSFATFSDAIIKLRTSETKKKLKKVRQVTRQLEKGSLEFAELIRIMDSM